jgi:hypothetical protein
MTLSLLKNVSGLSQDLDSGQEVKDMDMTWTRDLPDSDLAKGGLIASLINTIRKQ